MYAFVEALCTHVHIFTPLSPYKNWSLILGPINREVERVLLEWRKDGKLMDFFRPE